MKKRKAFVSIGLIFAIVFTGIQMMFSLFWSGMMESSSSETVLSPDGQRQTDLIRFANAATDYQANNIGRTPWYGDEKKMDVFVRRYIDSEAIISSNSSDTMLWLDVCGEDFRDPSGECYTMQYLGESGKDVADKLDPSTDSRKNQWRDNHTIVVVGEADCATRDGVIVETSLSYNSLISHYGNERYFVMFMVLSDNTVVCVANK